jgi:myo-inositol-1(or 4)-monophosphatase
VSQVDRRAEEAIVAALARARPHDAILAEEGTLASGSSGMRWVVDPLDDTTDYVYGYPVSCVSIAVEVDGELQVGVVHEPLADRTCDAAAERRTGSHPAPHPRHRSRRVRRTRSVPGGGRPLGRLLRA